MKKIILQCLLWAISTNMMAQVETTYYPDGTGLNAIEKKYNFKGDFCKVHYLEKPDIESILEEDEEHYKEHPNCFRYGRGINVNYTLDDGEWTDVEDGRVWSFTIEAEGALSLDFGFSNTSLSHDACLYVTNKNKTMVFGPVKQSAIKDCPDFTTDNMMGHSATIYLVVKRGSVH